MDSRTVLDKIVAIIGTHKAEDVIAFDVRKVVSYADYVLVCSGQSSRQVSAIGDHVVEDLKREGIEPLGIEGKHDGGWVLLDYGSIIVHLFDDPVRAFYNLEAMWSDAPRVPLALPAAPLQAFH